MSTLAQRIAVQSKVEIDAQIAGIQRRTSESQRLLLWQSGLLIPLAMFAIVVLTFGVGRPLRRIDRAISELGRGNLSHPISVSGPQGHRAAWPPAGVAARPPAGLRRGAKPILAAHVT